LKIKFKDMPGLRKVEAREYVLRDTLTFEDLPHSLPFDRAFKPHRHIDMSMIFPDEVEVVDSCPKCRIGQPELVGGFLSW
jgi:hypothetical protein